MELGETSSPGKCSEYRGKYTYRVVEGAPPLPAVCAALLKDAVSKSGLFYESHQAQWVAGEKSLVDILREPQGRLSEARAFTNSDNRFCQCSASCAESLDFSFKTASVETMEF